MATLYDVSRLGTDNNYISFNDESSEIYARVKRTNPEQLVLREENVPLPGVSGIADYETRYGKSYLSIDGVMYPNGEAAYYQGRQLLRNISSVDISQNDPLSDHGYVRYTWQEAGTYKFLNVKVERVDGIGESTTTGFQQPFSFYCKIKNPVIYDQSPVTTTLNVDNTATAIGSAQYPFSFPVVYGKNTYTSNGTVINAGTMGAYPAINIFGPVNVPRVTNTSTGEFIEVNVNLATASDYLSITYDVDRAPSINQGGTSVYNKVTTASTFFKIKPGQNQLQLTGSSISNGAYATISFFSTYPLI